MRRRTPSTFHSSGFVGTNTQVTHTHTLHRVTWARPKHVRNEFVSSVQMGNCRSTSARRNHSSERHAKRATTRRPGASLLRWSLHDLLFHFYLAARQIHGRPGPRLSLNSNLSRQIRFIIQNVVDSLPGTAAATTTVTPRSICFGRAHCCRMLALVHSTLTAALFLWLSFCFGFSSFFSVCNTCPGIRVVRNCFNIMPIRREWIWRGAQNINEFLCFAKKWHDNSKVPRLNNDPEEKLSTFKL